MPLILFALFLAVPLIEIALFIVIGDEIGLWPTLGLVVLTAIVGTAMIRMQSFQVIQQARLKADRGEPPVAELGHGLGLILAGAFLITPGFFTDVVGLALLIPGFRRWLGGMIARYVTVRSQRRPDTDDDIIDGDYQDVSREQDRQTKPRTNRPLPGTPADNDADKKDANPDSPWRRG